jgi:hypothetical protein
MYKWIVEQWRDGEEIRRMEFMEGMIQHRDGTVVITFPPHEMAGGLVIAMNDELRLTYTYVR